MSIGPSGIIGSAAGSQLSQAQGTDLNKAQQDTANQARQIETDRKAESAAGIGETEQDEQISDRDADGRRLWEEPLGKGEQEDETTTEPPHKSKDATGSKGNKLDLNG